MNPLFGAPPKLAARNFPPHDRRRSGCAGEAAHESPLRACRDSSQADVHLNHPSVVLDMIDAFPYIHDCAAHTVQIFEITIDVLWCACVCRAAGNNIFAVDCPVIDDCSKVADSDTGERWCKPSLSLEVRR